MFEFGLYFNRKNDSSFFLHFCRFIRLIYKILQLSLSSTAY